MSSTIFTDDDERYYASVFHKLAREFGLDRVIELPPIPEDTPPSDVTDPEVVTDPEPAPTCWLFSTTKPKPTKSKTK